LNTCGKTPAYPVVVFKQNRPISQRKLISVRLGNVPEAVADEALHQLTELVECATISSVEYGFAIF